MFVREFDGRALVWFLLLGVVFDLGERDLETDADHLELDGLDDRDNAMEWMTLSWITDRRDDAPPFTPRWRSSCENLARSDCKSERSGRMDS